MDYNTAKQQAQSIITLCGINPHLLANRTDRLNTLLLGLAVCVHAANPDECLPELQEYIALSVAEIKSIKDSVS